MIKTTCWRGIKAPRVPLASRENVWAIGSRRLTFDGASSSPHSSANFSHKPLSVSAASPTGWNRRILRLFELFNLLAPFLKLLKCATARTSHAKVIVKRDTSIEVWFFSAKEVRWRFNRRPQRASWRIGASDPPLYSCKNLRIVWKRPYRRFLWFNPDFTAKLQFFPSSKADEGTPF